MAYKRQVIGKVIIKRRKRKVETETVMISFRVPAELINRIDELAQKGLVTRSAWMIKALSRVAYKGKTGERTD